MNSGKCRLEDARRRYGQVNVGETSSMVLNEYVKVFSIFEINTYYLYLAILSLVKPG